MAGGGSDGSIIIDTELDNEGFESGSGKLLSAIKALTQTIESFGTSTERSFVQIISLLSQMTSAAGEVNAEMARTATQVADANERAAQSEQQLAQSAQQAKQAMGSTVSDAQLTRIQKQIDATKAKLAEYYAEKERIAAQTDEALAQTTTDDQAARVLEMEQIQLQNLDAKYAAHLTQLQRLEAEYQRVAAAAQQAHANNSVADDPSAKNMLADIQAVEKAMDKYAAKLDKMSTLGASDRQWQSLGYDIDAAAEKAARLQAALDALRDSGAIPADQYEYLSSVLGQVGDRASDLSARIPAMTQSVRGFTALTGSVSGFGKAFMATCSSIKSGVTSAVASLKRYITQSTKAELSSKGLVKALMSVKTMLISRIKRMFISSIINSVKTAMQSLAGLSSEVNAAMSSIKNSFKGLAANVSVSLGNLITAVAPVITQAINAIATVVSWLNALFAMLGGRSTILVAKKQTDSYADSLAGAGGAAKELKEQVYGFDELNKRQSDSGSGGGGGGGGGGAGDLFEEIPIEDLLPDFIADMFARLKEAFENGDWEGIGAIIADGINDALFAVDDWINNKLRPKGEEWAVQIARILNGLTERTNWYLIGQTLADGLDTAFSIFNGFMDTYSFEALGTGLGATLNGLVENTEWDEIGEGFAQKWQALIDTIHGFVHEVKWDKLGEGIGTAVQGWFDTIDWAEAADTLSTGINGIVLTFSNFVNDVSWYEDGKIIGQSISNAIEDVDWTAVGQSITDGVSSLISFVAGTAETLEWGDITGAVGDALRGALDRASEKIHDVDWEKLCKKIYDDAKDTLEKIDFDSLANSFFSFLGSAFGAAVLTIDGFFEGAWDNLKAYFEEKVKEAGGSIPKALLSGILEGFNIIDDIKAWIKEHIANPFYNSMLSVFGVEDGSSEMENIGGALSSGFVNGLIHNIPWLQSLSFVADTFGLLINFIESLFDIGSPSKVMEEIGGNVIAGFLNGITGAWKSVMVFFSDALSGLSTAWGAVQETASSLWDGIKSTVTERFEAAKQAVASTAEIIKSGLSTVWGSIKTKTATAWNGVKTTVTTAFNSAKTAVSNTAGRLKKDLSTTWNDVQSKASSAWTDTKTAVSNTFTGLKEKLTTTADNLNMKLSTVWEGARSTAATLWDSLRAGVSSTFISLKEDLDGTAEDIKTSLSTAWGAVQDTASSLWERVKSTVTERFVAAKQAVSNTAESIKTGLSAAWGAVQDTASTLWEGVKSTVTERFEAAKQAVSNTAEDIKTGLSTAWGAVQNTASSLWEGIKSTVSGTFDSLKSDLVSGANAINSNLSSAWESTKSTAATKWENVKNSVIEKWNGLKYTLSSTDWASIGDNICSGIKSGIDRSRSSLTTTVSNLASGLFNTAKRALGIASPSRLFRDGVGKNIDLGIAEGVSDNEKQVIKTVSNLAQATADSFDLQELSFDVSGNAVVSGLDTVTDRLSGVAAMFKSIASMLSDVGLRAPEIAMGGVVPVKTRVDTAPASGVFLDGFQGFSSDVDDYLSDQASTLRQILDLLRRLDLRVDLDALTAAVTTRQRAAARSYGGV